MIKPELITRISQGLDRNNKMFESHALLNLRNHRLGRSDVQPMRYGHYMQVYFNLPQRHTFIVQGVTDRERVMVQRSTEIALHVALKNILVYNNII